MNLMTETPPSGRPPSPWSGSHHEDQHRWQLDRVRTLAEAAEALRDLAEALRDLAEELEAAARAGWWLVEPMARGHLMAARASRRTRTSAVPPDLAPPVAPRLPAWRLRVVDEPPGPGDAVLDLRAGPAARTPAVGLEDGAWRQVAGPDLDATTLEELRSRLEGVDAGGPAWGVARARVGPFLDVVADGSALRVHAIGEAGLVRTVEVLAFLHGADRARTLPAASAAYRRLARATEMMAASGGRLLGTDDGLLHVGYEA